MTRSALAAGATLAVVVSTVLPATAGTPSPTAADTPSMAAQVGAPARTGAVAAASRPALAEPGRPARRTVPHRDKVRNLPASLRMDQTVTALVELTGDPLGEAGVTDPGAGPDRGGNPAPSSTTGTGTAPSITTGTGTAPSSTATTPSTGAGTPSASAPAPAGELRTQQDAAARRVEAAGAEVTGRLDRVLNALRVEVAVRDLARVAALPGVRTVQVAQKVTRLNAAANSYTGTPAAWAGLRVTGRGQVIAVIDDGVEYTHADFGGPGTAAAYTGNDRTVVEPGSFPTAKVVGGQDFVGDDYDPESTDPAKRTPRPDPDPLPCGDHGTHVAGTAAGAGVTADGATFRGPYTTAGMTSTRFRVAPGSAPQATLLAYKVFGCGEVSTDDAAIVDAIDAAVAAGADVINLSLGAPFGTARGLGAKAVDNATEAGVLVVSSAGNEGAGAYLTGAPGASTKALSVAAMDAGLRRFPGISLTGAVSLTAVNTNEATVPAGITGELVRVGGLGCAAADYAGVAGRIALTTRGTCPRTDRAVLGQAAGAKAVIMVNDVPGPPPFDGRIPGVTIPFVGADRSAATALASAVGRTVTVAAGPSVANAQYTRTADFSSAGPRRLDSAPKPDVTAPGVSILSAGRGQGTGAVRISGTSMAAPHAAGIAALVRQSHPRWTPEQVKAALQSTANPARVTGFDVARGGTGLVQARTAVETAAYAWTPDGLNALAFGFRHLSGATRQVKSYRITNTSTRPVTYALSASRTGPSYGATLTVSPRRVTVPAGRTVTVSLTIGLSAAAVAALPGADASDGGKLASLRGVVVATPTARATGIHPLRTAFLLVPQGVSSVRATLPVLAARATSARITARNAGVHRGVADVHAWLLTDPAGDTRNPETADVVDVGVQVLPGALGDAPATDRLLMFAVNTARATSTHATQEVDLLVDTDRDGGADVAVFSADEGLVLDEVPNGTVAAFAYDIDRERLADTYWAAEAPANGSVLRLPVLASTLGLRAGAGAFGVTAASFDVTEGTSDVDLTGTARFDAYAPAVSSGRSAALAPGRSAALPVSLVRSRLASQDAKGWLVISPDDAGGLAEGDRVPLRFR